MTSDYMEGRAQSNQKLAPQREKLQDEISICLRAGKLYTVLDRKTPGLLTFGPEFTPAVPSLVLRHLTSSYTIVLPGPTATGLSMSHTSGISGSLVSDGTLRNFSAVLTALPIYVHTYSAVAVSLENSD